MSNGSLASGGRRSPSLISKPAAGCHQAVRITRPSLAFRAITTPTPQDKLRVKSVKQSFAAAKRGAISQARDAGQRRVLGPLQRLCCLGLGGEAIVPGVMRDLDAAVPSRFCAFRFIGPDMTVRGSYGHEFWPSGFRGRWAENYSAAREGEVFPSLHEIIAINFSRIVFSICEELLKVDMCTYLHSGVYNLIYKYLPREEVIGVCFPARKQRCMYVFGKANVSALPVLVTMIENVHAVFC